MSRSKSSIGSGRPSPSLSEISGFSTGITVSLSVGLTSKASGLPSLSVSTRSIVIKSSSLISKLFPIVDTSGVPWLSNIVNT